MIIRSLESQTNFDGVSKDEGSKQPMEKPPTLDEVKKTKNKILICMNIFQPWLKIVQPYNNNLVKPMLYFKIHGCPN
jgi:hypothetical protein